MLNYWLLFSVLTLLFLIRLRVVREWLTWLRYQIELGGKDGLRVTGLWSYPGRYLSKNRIKKVLLGLHTKGQFLYIHVPSAKYGREYSDQIELTHDGNRCFDIQLLPSDAQSYVYLKRIETGEISELINQLEVICKDPEQHGFVLMHF